MARYKKRPAVNSSLQPGLFDDFEAPATPGAPLFTGAPEPSSAGTTGPLSTPSADPPDLIFTTSIGSPSPCLSPFADLPPLPSPLPLAGAETRSRRTARPETIFADGDDLMPLEAPAHIDRLDFISFGSGSSGNCAYVGSSDSGILIDAGVAADTVEAELRRYGISMNSIRGIILTHDHSDHVRFIYPLVRKRPHIGVYCTPKVLNGMLRRHNISRRIKDYHRAIYKEHPFRVAGFEITAFEVPHDGTDNAGFFITRGHHRLAVATDLGHVSERADFYLRRANYVMIEANYDSEMLDHGPYPEYLRARIRSANGHLCNDITAAYLASIASTELKYIFLCHLSKDNNTPTLALHTVEQALTAAGLTVGDGSGTPYALRADLQLLALPRFDSSGLIALR